MTGRRTKLTKEIEIEIFDRIADGESMREICSDKSMPNRRTVLRWLEADEGLATRYARARELQADALEEGMATVEKLTLDGSLNPQAASVVLASRRWRAEKLAPKKYGDRKQVDHGGSLSIQVITGVPEKK